MHRERFKCGTEDSHVTRCTERGSNVVQRTVMSLDAQREVQMWYRGSNVVQRFKCGTKDSH